MPSGTKLVISKGSTRKIWTNQLDYLKKTVMPALKKAEYAVLFSVKVNSSDFPEYPKIVKKPMDFSLIESRLKEHYYTCAAECVDDIETVFANCCIFNQAAEDITLIGEHIIRKRFVDKMEDFPKEEVPMEKKKRGPGRRRQPASPVYSESDGPVATRRHSIESIESQPNTASYMGNDGLDVSPANGEKKGQVRSALISRITKDQSSNLSFKISSTPRREREARPQMGSGSQVPSGSSITNSEFSKPNLRLCPSLAKCQKLVYDMLNYRRRRFNWPFVEPVDPVALNIPDYFDIVKNPMDLSTIKQKLDNGLYKHKDEVKADIDLMISNCTLYNGPNTAVTLCGQELMAFFTKKFTNIPEDPPDTPPVTDGKRKRSKSHKRSKRHKRDRIEEEIFRLRGLSPEFVQEMHPEEQSRLRTILSHMEEVLTRMSLRATEYDHNMRFLMSCRDKLGDEVVPVLQNIEPMVKEMHADLNHVRSLQAALLSSPLSNGSGRPAGRPRKRALLNEGDDGDATFAPGKGSGARGKRKRMGSLQPILPPEEPARLPPIPSEVPGPIEESISMARKPTIKPVKEAPAAVPGNSAPHPLLKKEESLEAKMAYEEAAMNSTAEHILTYEEKAALSLELQRVTDAAVLHELGAIVQRYEPSVQSASSGELDVDLSTLSNVTLLALKKVLDRAKVPTSAANLASSSSVSAAAMATSSAAADVTKSDSEEDMEEEYDEPVGEHQMASSSDGPGARGGDPMRLAERMGEMSAPDNGGMSAQGERLFNPANELSNLSSDADASYSDCKPRGRRNARKTSHPVRHRSAGTVLGANASSVSLAESEKSSSKFGEDSSANETDATVPMLDSTIDPAEADHSAEAAMREPEPLPDLSTRGLPPSPVPPPAKPVRDHAKKNVVAKALPTGSKRGRVDRKSETELGPKMETSTPVSKQSPGLSHMSSDEDHLDKCDSDNEGYQSARDSEGESKPLVGQPCPHRTVYEIFDEGSKSDAAKRRNATTSEDPLMEIQAKYKSLIYSNKSERINRELERENEVRERREEEEKRKRDDEERKRKEEAEKEARKEALKEQERRRLNEIRARNRRADMPLRQYADMANFEKQLDYSLINPRWF